MPKEISDEFFSFFCLSANGDGEPTTHYRLLVIFTRLLPVCMAFPNGPANLLWSFTPLRMVSDTIATFSIFEYVEQFEIRPSIVFKKSRHSLLCWQCQTKKFDLILTVPD